jgi:hypothetical protein
MEFATNRFRGLLNANSTHYSPIPYRRQNPLSFTVNESHGRYYSHCRTLNPLVGGASRKAACAWEFCGKSFILTSAFGAWMGSVRKTPRIIAYTLLTAKPVIFHGQHISRSIRRHCRM